MKKRIGVVGVDAGCIMVGDPCYMHGADSELMKAYPTWASMRDEFTYELNDGAQLQYAIGHAGLGVVVRTTHGDGTYPVYLETDDNGKRRLIVELG